MNKQKLVRAFAIATVALLGLLPSTSISSAADPIGSMGPVPKAHCGRFDWTESGLQGQTTTWERESGDSAGGYNCNLELVGQFRGEGAFSQDDRRSLITAPTWQRKMTLCSSTPASW